MVGFTLLSRSYYYLRRRSPGPPFPPDHRQAGERGAKTSSALSFGAKGKPYDYDAPYIYNYIRREQSVLHIHSVGVAPRTASGGQVRYFGMRFGGRGFAIVFFNTTTRGLR